MDKKAALIPEQETGFEINVRDSVGFDDPEAATQFFRLARARLLDINHWSEISSGISTFELTDASGKPVFHQAPQVGHYLKIDVPGPASLTGEGFDWVRIEAIVEQQDELTSIRVRPAPCPLNEKPDPAHFLKEEATSTFMVFREGNKVFAEVHGRNEKANTDTPSVVDKVRNVATTLGSWLGLGDMQWKNLVKGLVKV